VEIVDSGMIIDSLEIIGSLMFFHFKHVSIEGLAMFPLQQGITLKLGTLGAKLLMVFLYFGSDIKGYYCRTWSYECLLFSKEPIFNICVVCLYALFYHLFTFSLTNINN
jgi:hypothetical protein